MSSSADRSRRALPVVALLALATSGCTGTVPMEAAPTAADVGCAEIAARLPSDVVGLTQRETDAQGTGAWGEPALVLARADGEPRLHVEVPADAPPTDEVALDEIARAFEFLTFLEVKPAAEIPGQALGESRFDLADGLTIHVAPTLDAGNVWIRLRAEGGEEAQRLEWGRDPRR